MIQSLRFVLLLTACISLASCSGGSKNLSSGAGKGAPAEESDSVFKVALLTPGPVSDAGWSALAFEGLKVIESELGAQVNNQEATGTKIRDAMRTYAQDGYRLILGHGFEYNAPGVELASQFPNTVFLSSSGGATAPNAGAFRFQLEQGFYLAGIMGASMSKSGVLAMIGGPQVPSIQSTFKAFVAGAKSVNPEIRVEEKFTGKDSDVAAAKQATLAAIAAGADFVIHQTNAAAQGVFDACAEKGAYAFGANADQNANPSGAVIASAIIVAKPAFVALARKVKDGAYKGEVTAFGMDKGAIDFVVNPKLADKVPQSVVQRIDAVKADIVEGRLSVPMDQF